MSENLNGRLDKYTFIWKVSDYLLSPHRYIRSSSFRVVFLFNTSWYLCIDLKSPGNVENIECYLYRSLGDDGPSEVKALAQVTLTGEGVEVCDKGDLVFRCFKKRDAAVDSLCVARIQPEAETFNSSIEVKCTIVPIVNIKLETGSEENVDMVSFSADMATLYKTSLYYDTILTAEGYAFATHRAILHARAPKLVQRIPIRFTTGATPTATYEIVNISRTALSYFLLYIYTGTLPSEAVAECYNLFRVAQYFDMRDLKMLLGFWIKSTEEKTILNTHKGTFIWSFDSSVLLGTTMLLPYVRSILVDKFGICRVWMMVKMQNTSSGSFLQVSFEFPTISDTLSILLSCKLTIANACSRHSLKRISFLIGSGQKWTSQPLISRRDLQALADRSATPDKIHFEIEIAFSGGKEATAKTTTVSPGVRFVHLGKDMGRMLRSVMFFDMNLLTESGHNFGVHRSVLSARSSVFKQLIETEGENRCITLTDINHETLSDLLKYIYSAEWTFTTIDSANLLLRAAGRFEVKSLKASILMHLAQVLVTARSQQEEQASGERSVETK